MRSGTLPTPLCVGLGEACAIAQREMGAEAERLRGLRDRFYKKIREQLPEVYLNGDLDSRIPGNLNLSFAYVEGEGLMMGIKDVAVSSGSACTTPRPSSRDHSGSSTRRTSESGPVQFTTHDTTTSRADDPSRG